MAVKKSKAVDEYDYTPSRRRRRTSVRVSSRKDYELEARKAKVAEAYQAGRNLADAVFDVINLFL